MATDSEYTAPTEFAGAGLRLFAFLLDSLILVAGWLFVLFLIKSEPDSSFSLTPIAIVASALLYPLLGWWLFQATPGMFLTGLRLVATKPSVKPGLWECLLRILAWLLATLPLGLGLALIWRDPRRQALHDRIAGTLVVVDDEAHKPLRQLMDEVT